MGIIEIRDFCFKYNTENNDNNNTSFALRNINMEIEEGEIVLLFGKSGCGKSTLLRTLKKSLSPCGKTSGSIFVKGKEVNKISDTEDARLVGFVMQNPDNQIVTDKVWHELAFGLENMGFDNETIRIKVAEMSTYFGINDWFHKDTATLSGGQKQLLNLAGVMAMSPEILILDEPTSQLDPIAAGNFLETIKKINRDFGTTIFITEHRIDEVINMAHRIAIMDKGSITTIGTANEVMKFLVDNKIDLLNAMPLSGRISAAFGEKANFPMTVGEGRKWIREKGVDKKDVEEKISRFKVAKEGTIEDKTIEDKTIKDKIVKIEIKDLYFAYDKKSDYVISGLNTKIYKGEIYALLGGNASGKSTLLSLISGVEKPVAGKILIDNKKVWSISTRELYGGILGVVPQNPQTLFAKDTVGEELDEMQGVNKNNTGMALTKPDVIKLCQLDNILQQHPYDLSGGEAGRVALAKILLLNPQILLLDEPTKGMDITYKNKFANILCQLKEKGVTVIMVSHDVEFCGKVADRCGLLFDGKITGELPRDKFFENNTFYTTAENKILR